MKRFVMAVALTGVISVTTLAGNVPTGDFVAPPPLPGNVPTNDFVPPPPTTTSSTLVNTIVVDLILTITNLIGR